MEGSLNAASRELVALDPGFESVIELTGPRELSDRWREGGPFTGLLKIVCGQQVSTAAARTIWGRVTERFGDAPEPERIAAAEEALRECGLSGRKASYMRGLAEAVLAGELEPDQLGGRSDSEVIEAITALRGFGQWSAEMFLMFDLRRPDVFSGGDLGLRNGIKRMRGLEQAPSPVEADEIALAWSPQRTLASVYLWALCAVELP